MWTTSKPLVNQYSERRLVYCIGMVLLAPSDRYSLTCWSPEGFAIICFVCRQPWKRRIIIVIIEGNLILSNFNIQSELKLSTYIFSFLSICTFYKVNMSVVRWRRFWGWFLLCSLQVRATDADQGENGRVLYRILTGKCSFPVLSQKIKSLNTFD